MTKKVGIIGSGPVGVRLAGGLRDIGYQVTVGSRQGKKIENWEGAVDNFKNTAKNADLVVLALKGTVAEEVVSSLNTELAGKTVIDTTNPLSDEPPENGVLKYFTNLDESLMERLQKAAPKAKFVKAFNSVGNAVMINPDFGDIKPTMFICGNDTGAKKETAVILNKFSWEVEDLGAVQAARAIEPLCMLWCIPGFVNNQWNHAFKLLKK